MRSPSEGNGRALDRADGASSENIPRRKRDGTGPIDGGTDVRLPRPEVDCAERGDPVGSQGVPVNAGGLELRPVDDGQSPGVDGISPAVIPAVEVVVNDDDRVVVVAQGRPGHVMGIPVPVDPGRTPIPGGNPVPSETQPPVPAAVAIDAPTPRL